MALLAALALPCPAPPAWAVLTESTQFYDDAVARLERNDMDGAVTQLNNALQKDPNLLSAHVLLGKTRLKIGNPAGAEVSFDKALRLGVDRAEVALPLAQAYAAQRKFDALLERIKPEGLPRPTQIEILVLRGNAHSEKDDTAAALSAFEEASALNPQSVAVRLALVNMLIRMEQLPKAAAELEEALKLAPDNSAAWNLRAHMSHLKGDLKSALQDYSRSIALDPKNVDAMVAEAGLLLDVGRLEDAEKALGNLQKVAPGYTQASYLRAVVARRKDDGDGVRAELTNVVNWIDRLPKEVLGRHRELLLMGGLAHHGLGNLEKATGYLTLYVRANPKQLGPAKILASIHIDRRDIGRAIEVLGPLEVSAPNDPQVLTLLAAARIAEHHYAQANSLLERAVKLSNGAPDARVNLGVSLIASGQADIGFSQLQQAFVKDSTQARAGIVMATLYLKREQPKKALEMMDAVVRRDPKNVDAINLQGIARVSAGDRAGGRAAYEKALALDPKFYAARLNIARLDIAEGKSDAARAGLTELLNINPKDGDPMIEFARLEEQVGRPGEAIKWLETAMTIPNRRTAAGVYLSGLLLRQRDFERAVSVAKDASSRAPSDLTALFALSRAELAKGDKTSARQTLAAMVPLAGSNPSYNVDIAKLQISSGDRTSAYRSLDKALQEAPDYLPALVLLTEMEIADGNQAKAEPRARRLVERFPTRGVGSRLMGDIATARGQANAAIASYRASLAKEKSAVAAIRLYDALVLAGGRAKALAFLEQWNRDTPNDPMILRAMADGRAGTGNLAAARSDYERLLQRNPNDVEVLNNLAQVAMRQEDSAALGYAERAYQLGSNRAAVLDTLGWVLVRQGQLDRGTYFLREARLRESANPEIRYHLAVALAKAGRDAEARSELKVGLKEGAAYEGIDDARALQRKLSP